jgi:hypothetical protein
MGYINATKARHLGRSCGFISFSKLLLANRIPGQVNSQGLWRRCGCGRARECYLHLLSILLTLEGYGCDTLSVQDH